MRQRGVPDMKNTRYIPSADVKAIVRSWAAYAASIRIAKQHLLRVERSGILALDEKNRLEGENQARLEQW